MTITILGYFSSREAADSYAHAGIYNSTAASITPGSSPTVVTFPNTVIADSQFDPTTGVLTFMHDCILTSVFFTCLSCTYGSPIYWTDAEVSTDGGTTWVRGNASARQEQLRSTDGARTREFPFSGFFAAGVKLRFVEWASDNTVRLTTNTNSGSTVPARRLTYSTIEVIKQA